MKRFLYLFAFLGLWANGLSAQDFGMYELIGRGGVGTTFATDYQAVNVNPANLGLRKSFRDPRYTLGFAQANFQIASSSLTRNEVLKSLFTPDNVNFSFESKQEAANKIANEPLALDADVMLFGAGFSDPDFGGFAFTVQDNIRLFMRMNQTGAEIMFLGANAPYFPELFLSDGRVIPNNSEVTEEERLQVIESSFRDSTQAQTYGQLLDGSKFTTNWYREYALSYGRHLFKSYNFQMYAGVTLKLIRGIALFDLEAENGQLTRQTISLSSSFEPVFTSDDPATVTNPTAAGFSSGATFLQRSVFPTSVGSGFGFNWGMHFVIKQNLHVGVSMSNIGSVNWNGNVYRLNDGILVQLVGSGYDDYHFSRISPELFQFAGTDSPFDWQGSEETRIALPTQIRAGVSYEFFKTAHIGVDVILPQNKAPGNLDEPFYAIGADYRLTRTIRVSTGFNLGGNNRSAFNIPFGVTYTNPRGFFETGIATRDINTYITDLGDGAVLSLAAAFLRVKI